MGKTTGRRKVAVTLTLMGGAEPWIRVAHPTGWFKVPATTSLLETLQGALVGWNADIRLTSSEATVRVPVALWMELRRRAGDL